MAAKKKSKRVQIPRQEMPIQDPIVRGSNFNEVALGLSEESAKLEAQRCIQCKKPLCVSGCPVEVRIPEFIQALRDDQMWDSVEMLKDKNNLPAICGRVCPQESQCEDYCVLGRKGEPVAIGRLERYVADWELGQGVRPPERPPATGKRVAVVGAGPAGLTCAGDLAKLGHEVTIFESLHAPGGVLTYGIPEFRLPKDIVMAEVDYVRALGADLELDVVVGKTLTLDEILTKEGYDAIFLGTGAGLPMFMNIPGENLNGVYSANEYLTRVNLMKAYQFPGYDTPIKVGKRVAVVGAGNVAMDSCRSALRLGADEVFIVYRRSKAESPARAEELENAIEEGIKFHWLTNPVEIFGNDNGWVRAMRCIQMELGEPDASGRRRPVPISGSEFEIEVDTVVQALGTRPNPLVFFDAEGLNRTRWGTVEANEENGRTTKPGVWAGGDIVTGAATVISAMGAGKRAAADIDAYFNSGGETWEGPQQ
jgi:glutamate synthase (NADPH/NADH) small chain